MTETESEMLYEKHVNLIRKIVWKFIKTMGLDSAKFDEYFSKANLYYMLAATTYDGESSKFSTWIHIQIWNRLLRDHAKNKWEWERVKRLRERHIETSTCIHTRTPIWWLLDELSEDSKFLVSLIWTGKLDDILFNNKGTPMRRTLLIKNVYRFLKHYGWNRVRIHRCFKNIKKSFE